MAVADFEAALDRTDEVDLTTVPASQPTPAARAAGRDRCRRPSCAPARSAVFRNVHLSSGSGTVWLPCAARRAGSVKTQFAARPDPPCAAR